jgi:hypothetical protein
LSTGTPAFISVAACGSTGPNDVFIRELDAATGAIAIGSRGDASSRGNWLQGAVWTVDKDRAQVNADGTIKVARSRSGSGMWKPFRWHQLGVSARLVSSGAGLNSLLIALFDADDGELVGAVELDGSRRCADA